MVTAGDSQGDPSTPSHIRSVFTPYDSIDLGVRVVWCAVGFSRLLVLYLSATIC